jgi:RNA polymerase sigma factor (sigma-70 family)
MEAKTLLAAAASGDQTAWNALVEKYTNLLWSIARSYRLSQADAGDAVQMTWLKLVENLDRIADPDRLPGWLATTVRRECLQLIRRARREHPAWDGESSQDAVDQAPPVDQAMLENERDTALWRALTRLTEKCQRLLRVLMATPPPGYTEVAAALDMPIGSIGPARQRCLAQLRKVVDTDGWLGATD